MRLRVCLDNSMGTRLPINHQEWLTAAVYGLLATSDADYAAFLHDEGYRVDDGPKTFKLFTFSWLRGARRTVDGDWLRFAPGPLEWQVASPVDAFLTHLATGLLAAGQLRVGPATLPILGIDVLPAPVLTEPTVAFTCLSPLVAALPLPGGRTRYLRPCDGDAFGEAVRRNLLRKHRLLHGAPPANDRLALTFDPAYLARTNGGTKLVTYKDIRIVGAFCPFIATGSTELMETGYQAGFGEKNAGGFGMVEVNHRNGNF